jgi:hypothetical protein
VICHRHQQQHNSSKVHKQNNISCQLVSTKQYQRLATSISRRGLQHALLGLFDLLGLGRPAVFASQFQLYSWPYRRHTTSRAALSTGVSASEQVNLGDAAAGKRQTRTMTSRGAAAASNNSWSPANTEGHHGDLSRADGIDARA